MPSPWGPIALAAGVTAASTLALARPALAQPIVSPREAPAPAEQPAPAGQPAPAEQPAPAPAEKARPTRAGKSTHTARATRAGKSGKSTKAAKASRAGKSTQATKSKKVAKAAKPTKRSKPSRSRKSRAPRPSASPPAPPQGASASPPAPLQGASASPPAPLGVTAAAMPSAAPVRTAAGPSRAGRGRADNMPRGFTWPATPAMKAAGKACEAQLDALGVTWKPAAPEGRIVDAVLVPTGELGGVQYTSKWQSPPHKLDCQLARALAQIGPELHAAGVREIRWGSIYRWSNVRTQGKTFPFLSRHALGLAMDIVEFVDAAGRVANVQRDYLTGDSLLAAVERAVNDSGKFRLVLTPRNDPKSHHDHFHIEANPDYAAP